MMIKGNYPGLWAEALATGSAAGENALPTPMTVVGGAPGGEQKRYYVADGACGWAWVKVIPGNCAFANWLKKQGFARSSYSGGVDINIRDFGQSMERKYAMARAMAAVFSDAGINAYADSRMD